MSFILVLFDRQLKKSLTEDVIKEIAGDHHTAGELEREWEMLQADRAAIRETFPKGDSKVCEDTSNFPQFKMNSVNCLSGFVNFSIHILNDF